MLYLTYYCMHVLDVSSASRTRMKGLFVRFVHHQYECIDSHSGAMIEW